MIIADNEVKEIIVTAEDGELIASITDADVIEKDGYTVQLYPYD